ncbi:MAG TPA: site-2 protease family protein [Candidatus Binatia bacterium]|nr:site-2 protease family protein [Candidatus Binatia bacterium]
MANETASLKPQGLRIFKIAGIQIRLDYSWLIIFVLVLWSLSAGYFPHYYPDQTTGTYWLAGLVATLFFFASILTHELSHSLVARRFGIEIREITLFIFGGLANIAKEPTSPKSEFTIAIVGPFTSFVLAALFWGITVATEGIVSPLTIVIFDYLAWINLALGIFNLLPGFPLDGGRVFRAIWWWKTGSLVRATKVASDIGKGLALALMIFGALNIFAGSLVGGLWFIFIGMFLRGLAVGGYQQVIVQQSLEGTQARDIMIRDVVSVPAASSLSSVVSDYFLRYGFRGFPVTRDGEILGVISLAQVRQIAPEERGDNDVGQVMVPRSDKIEIAPDASLAEALKRMTQEDIGRLLVVENDRVVGMITKTGLLRYWEARRALEDNLTP